MKNRLAFAALAVGLLLSGVVFAGFETGQQVVMVDNGDGSGLANADLGYAHNTPDRTQYLGCNVYGWGTANVYCYAQGLDGRYRSCFSSSPGMVQTAASINGDSYVLFYWNSAGNCTYLSVNNQSSGPPKR